jgi:hypothetical protein
LAFCIYIAEADSGCYLLTKQEGRRVKKKMLLVAVVLGAVLVMGTVSIVASSASRSNIMFGGLGSTHEHAAFLVMIEGKPIDFSQDKFQVKSPYIHVENGVGIILHKHAAQVPVGEFFKSVGMQVTDDCFVSDGGENYCNGDGKRLRFFLDGTEYQPSLVNRYILSESEKFLLFYGEDSEQAVGEALQFLDSIAIPKF